MNRFAKDTGQVDEVMASAVAECLAVSCLLHINSLTREFRFFAIVWDLSWLQRLVWLGV